jgi:hypothetical protein
MFPIGLHFQSFKPIKKLPMRVEQLSLEDRKHHLYKMMGMEYTKPLTKQRKIRKNKTKKIV